MLQRFLADRFRLKLRIESKEFTGYALVVAKSGLKLKASGSSTPPETPAGFPALPPGAPSLMTVNNRDSSGYILVRMTARQQPISELASIARTWNPDNEPVVDQTGLTGKYDFFLEHAMEWPGVSASGLPPAPSLSTALREQLGLELVRKKLAFPYAIVEGVSLTPSDN